MKTYNIKKGHKKFKPITNPLPIWKPKGFKITAKIHRGGWSSLEDWGHDGDWFDWQKLKGITNFFNKNNHQSAILAFRFGEQFETYEIVAYTNDKKGNWKIGQNIIVEGDEVFSCEAILNDDRVHYKINSAGGLDAKTTHHLKSFCAGRTIGSYAGGANNSAGKYGGRAFKDMSIDIDFKII